MYGSRSKVAFLLFFVFAAGAAAGVAADRLQLLPGAARAEETPSRSDRTRDRERRQTIIERFADDLGLTAEQRRHIDEILEDFRGDVKTMREEFDPRWRALLDTTRTRIEAVLTPEQVTRYRALLEERYERRRGAGRDRDEQKEGANGKREPTPAPEEAR